MDLSQLTPLSGGWSGESGEFVLHLIGIIGKSFEILALEGDGVSVGTTAGVELGGGLGDFDFFFFDFDGEVYVEHGSSADGDGYVLGIELRETGGEDLNRIFAGR